MLIQVKDLSVTEITVNWANETINKNQLQPGDIIRTVINDLSAINFKSPLDVVLHLNEKAKSYGSSEQFNVKPLIDLAEKIVETCGIRDDAQDVSSPFITAFTYNSVTDGMDRIRIPVGQVLYFIRNILTVPGRTYKSGSARVILNDHQRTEFSLVSNSRNNTAEFLLDCYITSAEEVIQAWTKK
ncbi:hypothetical protein ACT2VT_000786 [Pantoea agglomerans]